MSGMKAKTIKSVLRNKTDAWINSIEDEQLRHKCRRDVIVTGGCIASMLAGEKINDYDIYFRTYETALEVAQYYVEQFKQQLEDSGHKEGNSIYVQETKDIHHNDRIRIVIESRGEMRQENEQVEGIESEIYDDPQMIADLTEETEEKIQQDETEKKPYRPVFVSTNAITLSGKIQLIFRFYGEPDEIHENYDFVHCMNYWMADDGHLELRPKALQSLLSKSLVYHGSRYPVCSIFRLRKFISKGWTINAGQILKMVLQASELNLKDYSVLEDQLTGVDVTYFEQILDECRKNYPDGISQAYLIEIIDRMFGD